MIPLSALLVQYIRDCHRIILNYIELNFKFSYAVSFIIIDKMLIFFNCVLQYCYEGPKALFCPPWASYLIIFLWSFSPILFFIIINTI